MIHSVKVTNHLNEDIELVLRSPESTGLLVHSITGLGPVKSDVQITDIISKDGGIYNSARIGTRNIVMSLVFLPGTETVEELRHKVYKYFPIKQKIRLDFNTDTRKCYTYGYIESCDVEVFSKMEGAHISILCPDPYIYSIKSDDENRETVFSNMEYLFEFPFENNSVTEPLIELGNYELLRAQTVYYSGDNNVGIVIKIHAIGKVSGVTIYNQYTKEEIKLDSTKIAKITGSDIVSGDTITISTVKGDKYARLLRSGVTYNILNCLGKNPSWFELSKGDNVFGYVAEKGEYYIQMVIENETAYEGI